MSAVIEELRDQLKLPIGYEGRSYDDAVRDLDKIINKLIERETELLDMLKALKSEVYVNDFGDYCITSDGVLRELLDMPELR